MDPVIEELNSLLEDEMAAQHHINPIELDRCPALQLRRLTSLRLASKEP